MHLAFVNNALQMKTMVRLLLRSLVVCGGSLTAIRAGDQRGVRPVSRPVQSKEDHSSPFRRPIPRSSAPLVDSCPLSCCVSPGARSFSSRGSHCQHALDYDGHYLRQVIHKLHRHAGQCKAGIFVCCPGEDRSGLDTSYVFRTIPLPAYVYPSIESGLQALDSGLPESSSRPLTRRIVYDRIHYLLRHLIALVPTCPSTLHPLLSRNFPHKRQTQVEQVTYIRNLLRVTEYCPEIADRILSLIIDRAIQIDVSTCRSLIVDHYSLCTVQVEIQVELEELEEQLDSEEQNEVFDLDPFDTVVGQEGESSDVEGEDDDDGEDDNLSDLSSDAGGDPDDDENQEDVTTDFKHIQAMVNKLDSMLKVIFDHFNQTHASSDPVLPPLPSTPSSRCDSPSILTPTIEVPRPLSPATIEEGKALRRAQFHTLLSIFDRTILRTFKSRYTQFVVFWYSSLDPEFADLFQGMLVSKSLLEEDQPAVTRAAAASYIASFVSRAQFVDREGARRVVQVLCNFLRARLDVFEAAQQMAQSMPGGQAVNMNIAQHSVFYAVAQAVFLIFCFRWRDLLEDQDEVDEFAPTQGPPKKWMPELDVVQRVVTSELNPLKVRSCSPHPSDTSAHAHPAKPGLLVERRNAVCTRRARYWLRLLLLHHGRKPPLRVCTIASFAGT